LGSFWSAEFEVLSRTTLEELHLVIQNVVDFDDDHLYCFYTGTNGCHPKYGMYDAQNRAIFNISINDIYPLPKNHFLYYLFDYGDEWIFKILKSRKKPYAPEVGVEYPRLTKETGEKPIQYDLDDW
jgi:hypothetical protein